MASPPRDKGAGDFGSGDEEAARETTRLISGSPQVQVIAPQVSHLKFLFVLYCR